MKVKVMALCALAAMLVTGLPVRAENDFTLTPFFDSVSGGATAVAHADTDEDDSGNTVAQTINEGWSSGLAQAIALTELASADAFSRISICWDSEICGFKDDYLSRAYAKGSGIYPPDEPPVSYCGNASSEADLEATIGVTIESVSLPDAFPVYARCFYIGADPEIIGYNASWNAASYTGDIYQEGPAWSSILNRLPGGPTPNYEIVQIGHKLKIDWHGMLSSTASSCGDTGLTSLQWQNTVASFDVRELSGDEVSTRSFISRGRTFTGDRNYSNPCQYAAMAMIMDHYSQMGYPDLYQPTQTDYYNAFDQCRSDPNSLERGNFFAELMTRYLRNTDSCRAGGAVPLSVPGSQFFGNFAENYKQTHPLLVSGPEVDPNGTLLPHQPPDLINGGHAIVVQGIMTFRTNWGGDDISEEEWISVSDTWNTSPVLDDVVSIDYEENPPAGRYRGYFYDDQEWWPFDADDEYLYFPNRSYRFWPALVYPVVPDAWSFTLTTETFDEEPNYAIYWGLLEMEIPTQATVSLVEDDYNEERMWFLESPTTEIISLSVRPFAPDTSQIRILLDYKISAGSAINLIANGSLLTTIAGPPLMNVLSNSEPELPNEMFVYSAVYDLNGMCPDHSYIDFTLEFIGPAGRTLYLDEFVIQNLSAANPAANLDGEGGIDMKDFAVLAAAWQSSKGDANWNPVCNLAAPDDVIDLADLAVFFDNWLAGTE